MAWVWHQARGFNTCTVRSGWWPSLVVEWDGVEHGATPLGTPEIYHFQVLRMTTEVGNVCATTESILILVIPVRYACSRGCPLRAVGRKWTYASNGKLMFCHIRLHCATCCRFALSYRWMARVLFRKSVALWKHYACLSSQFHSDSSVHFCPSPADDGNLGRS